jgi:hypothetical protein
MCRVARAVLVSLALLPACRPASAPPAPKVMVTPPRRTPAVLDAFAASDRSWAYVDGQRLRQAVLPDLLSAVSSLRADVEVELATATAACGFSPPLSIDELYLRIRWEAHERKPPWSAVVRMHEPPDDDLRCLAALAPGAPTTSLGGRRAWQIGGAFVAFDEGLFVVANSAADAEAMLERLARPEPGSDDARAKLAGVLLAASIVGTEAVGTETLGVRWEPAGAGTRLALAARFPLETSARQVETIVRDGLLELLGSNASFEPGAASLAEQVVQGASVKRDGRAVDFSLDLPPLAGQTAVVSKLAALAVERVRLYETWSLTGEARETVYAIARRLVEYAAARRALGKPARFPPSAPLAPDDIPYGKRVLPNPRSFTHPSWQDIGFTLDGPTFYAYDFVTAADGKSAVVQARGDIDGDGTTSLFELDVRLDAHGAPVEGPVIRERDPAE